MIHCFDIVDVQERGATLEEAIILYNLRFWLEKNKANSTNIHKHTDGKSYVWTFNSVKGWVLLFPYLGQHKVRRALDGMLAKGLIISNNFNKLKYDRTKWYSLPEYEITQNPVAKNTNGFVESAEPIPDINTDINLENKPTELATPLSLGEETKSPLPEKTIDPPKVTDAKKVQLVFDLFTELKFDVSTLWKNKTQRDNAVLLYDSKGLNKIKLALEYYLENKYVIQHRGRKVIWFEITTPSSLASNMPELSQIRTNAIKGVYDMT